MDNLDIIRNRASIRKFKKEAVPHQTLKELCKLGMRAPTACNMQDWRFIIIDDDKLKADIVDSGASVLINMAPAGILVTYARDTKNYTYKDGIQSASAAIENILLAVSSFGLGACWICNLPTKGKLRKLLNIPALHEPVGYIILGYPENPTTRIQKLMYDEDELIGINKFPTPIKPMRSYSKLKTTAVRFLVAIYSYSPLWLKKSLLNRLIDTKFTKKF